MTYLFNRRAVVEVDTLRIEGLDVRFSVSAEVGNLGKAEIAIFNLNEEHRQEIETKKAIEVSLLVGYQDTDLTLLFKGDMRSSSSIRKTPDWVTTLRSGDGDKGTKARVKRSYKPGTPFDLVWKDVVDALKDSGIGVGNAIAKFEEGKYAEGISELLHGGAVQGDAMKELRRLARGANLDVGIQDEELWVTKIGEPLGTTAVKLTPQTGLISSPQRGAKGKLKLRSLIVPGLKPKRKVQVESSLISGLYVIGKAKYKGDTSANDWYADLECIEAP